jgi:pyrrolysine biosynthesis protein PylC
MLAAIVGGRLQGVELACLARHAGWRTLLLDRVGQVPARQLCDGFVQIDVTRELDGDDVLDNVDLVIPALENSAALQALADTCRQRGIPLAFDPDAYAVTRCKIASNRLFADLGIPTPAPWPACGFPLVAKPSQDSGSHGVVVLRDKGQVRSVFPHGLPRQGWVLQAYLHGPSYSLEVIGRPGSYLPLQVTELFMDAQYDCKRVAAPCRLQPDQMRELETMAVGIAEALGLTGLMDLEVVWYNNGFKVLEVDARFPSQTPLAVYHASGCNMVELLGDLFVNQTLPLWRPATRARGVVLAHVRVADGTLFVEGEHIMAWTETLERVGGFFGADEALTDYRGGARQWAATLIVTAGSREQAEQRYRRVLADIQRRLALEAIVDRSPEDTA